MGPAEQLSEDIVMARAVVLLLEAGAIPRNPRAIAKAADVVHVPVELVTDQWRTFDRWARERQWTAMPRRVPRRPLPDAARIFAALADHQRSIA